MKSILGRNYIFNLLYQILLIIIPIITMPYVSRILEADGIGIYNYSYSLVSVFSLFAVLGTNSYAIREVAYVQDNKEKYSSIFYEILFIRVLTTIFLIPIFCFVSIMHEKYFSIFLIMLINILDVIFDISWFYQGLEDFKKIVISNIAVRILGVILIFTLVKSASDISVYTMIMSGTLILGHIALWLYLPKYICKFNIHSFRPFKHLKPIIIFFIPSISAYIYTSLDKVILGFFTTEMEVGFYSQSEKITKLLITIITSLSTVLVPRMSSMIKKGEISEAKLRLEHSYRFVLFLSFPMMFGLLFLTKEFVPLFLGNGYEKCIKLMFIFVPLIIIMGMSSMTGTPIMLARGQQKEYNIIILLAAVINFSVNILLVKKLSSYGVTIGTIIAEAFVMCAEMYAISDMIDYRKIIKIGGKYCLNALIMCIPIALISQFLYGTLMGILVKVVVGILTYLILLKIQNDKMVNCIINVVRNLINIKLVLLKR